MIQFAKRFQSRCWIDVSRDGTPIGRMTFKLFDKECPKTVNNFKSILTASN